MISSLLIKIVVPASSAALLLSGCAAPPSSGNAAGTPMPTASSSLIGHHLPQTRLVEWHSGAEVNAHLLNGHVVSLWASWCTPCQAEFATLTLHPEHVVAVNVQDVASNSSARKTAQELVDTTSGAFPVYIDASDVLVRRLGLSGLPVSFAVNRSGFVVDVVIGQVTEASLARLVAASQS